ncbi:uncharacterized protein N0V89_003148 [Didymosphaeria variabile]|uniref:BHLH domain-containing protein n=1 Tax=Didymosphaeria variabile TaxID=1932322 RepID=A0A9W8XTZ0_9PLEO|nr:uncharacterized protein N0V89_003148 [Didymosphaeria variabile]KAJ4358564.1 hypothetical protein N0V89_003148 [Didymosphaeria variabile]
MNGTTGAPPAWSGAEHFDMAGSEHDFSNLLDFDLDFSEFANGSSVGHGGQQLEQLADELDVQHLHNPFSPQIQQQQQQQQSQLRNGARTPGAPQPQRHLDGRNGGHPHSMPQQSGFFEFSMPYQQHGVPAFTQAPDMYRPHAQVPPTPNSMELHGDPSRYLQQMDAHQAMFDGRFQMRKDESFTPLVSPAVTPHEPRFQVHDMTTVPGAYFSPLTSPALNAQNYPHAQTHSSHYGTTSGSSTGASPVDVDMDMLEEPAMSQSSQGRKLRSATKRSAPTRFSAAPARVRQSPIVKPARRKATVSSLIPPKEVTDLLEEERVRRPSSSGADLRLSRESSESDSISPGPLSEMGPPPKPTSVHPSPAMSAQTSASGVAPATPASLMRIHPSPTFDDADAPPALDDLTLPEASLDRPQLSRIDTALQEDQDTPRLAARKTPKLGPLSTPSGASAQSGKPSPSPMLSAISSPTSPAFFPGTNRKADPKSARPSKKRNSVTSTLVSPALRPKISPSIKPLLPDGSVSGDTHALLLASKSNYQNILDGTVVPGVSYPTSLSTNLTSKRTSHKIAEQGRRNRINTALQEMQALLPSPQLGAKESKSPESMTAAQSNNSKAAKVESAIDYIKALQKQCAEKDRALDQKDQEVEALRRELAAFKRSDSTGAASSADTALQSTEENGT